jgi:hypothetical protein
LISKSILEIINDDDVSTGIILGGRRKGKSVLGYGIIEALYNSMGMSAFVLGLPADKERHLPKYVVRLQHIDKLKDGSAFLVDEAYKEFYSRQSGSKINKYVDTLVALSGQKQLKSLYITQHARRLEIGIVGGVDFILFKKPSLMQMKFDRHQFRKILEEVYDAFQSLTPPEGISLGEYQKRCTYVISEDFVGMIENSNTPPTWWNEHLSRAYAGVPIGWESATDGLGRPLYTKKEGKRFYVQ